MKRIVVATRKSELALAQCRMFLDSVRSLFPGVEIVENHIVTSGDKILDRPLSEIGGKGLFLKEIEEALLAGEADMAVHSMKDVPPALYDELSIACIPRREDPRDVLVSPEGFSLETLPEGALLGTSSLRRAVQLKSRRPDLVVSPIRGNVGTRIAKCEQGVVHATVLARAGLNRLGISGARFVDLSPEECLPAVGQGALAIEIRSSNVELRGMLERLAHRETALAVEVERGVLASVEGDCKTPVAAFAEFRGERVTVRGLLANPDGTALVRAEKSWEGPFETRAAHELGRRLGDELLEARANS